MQEKVRGALQKGKAWWKAAAKRTKILLAAGVIAILAAVAVVAVVSLNQPYVTLFTALNQTDLTSVVSYLSDNGVSDYRIEGEDTILVPKDREEQLKADLLLQGYPASGFAYSTYFDNIGALTTESERNQLVLFNLMDMTANVIRRFDHVKDAVVLITPGEDHTYVLDSGDVLEAKATVTVTMEGGQMLTDAQVEAIYNLMSRAVQGLSIENVSIQDTRGNNYYASGDDLADIHDVSDLKMALEERTNNLLRTKIMEVLVPLYGEENVRVSVNSVVDVDRTYTDSTNYSKEDDGGTIIGQQIYERDAILGGTAAAGGVVGTQSNADINTYVDDQTTQANEDEVLYASSGEDNYLVDTEKQQVEHLAGTVVDVTVAVSINASAAGQTAPESLYPHIARAAGIGSGDQLDKISVLIAPFYQADAPTEPGGAFLEPWMLYAAGGALLLFLLLILVIALLVHRHRKKRRRRLEQEAAELGMEIPSAAPVMEGADIMDMDVEKSIELRRDVRKFAEENPEIAAQMVKNWLKEGDDDG